MEGKTKKMKMTFKEFETKNSFIKVPGNLFLCKLYSEKQLVKDTNSPAVSGEWNILTIPIGKHLIT